MGQNQGLEPKIYQYDDFVIFSLQKISQLNQPLRIYIEGDGRAFINKRIASKNPTPISYFLINLIAQDNSPNIVYLARPCQYQSDNDKACDTNKYWTKDRLAPEVIEVMNQVLSNFADFEIELIGYSGGGEIAKYLALRNDNVINLRTIAGNIDQAEFAQNHQVPKLDDNFSKDDLVKLAKVPQIHFVGAKDKIVPINVTQEYLKKLPEKKCSQIIEVENASHSAGWVENWRNLLTVPNTISIK